jgi:hypothetical protein
MITWLNVWPVFLVPTFLISAISAFPTIFFNGRNMGGGQIREYLLNHFVLPCLMGDVRASLVHWFSAASVFQEWLFSVWVAVNINALLLPFLFYFCTWAIWISSWLARKNLQLRRNAIR